MKSLPFLFIFLSTLFALAGMSLGIYMGISGDHSLVDAHAHNNLLGWVSMAIYGLFYRSVPAAAGSRLAQLHFWLALVGALAFAPGLVLVGTGGTQLVIQAASLLVIASMLVFAIVVWLHRSELSRA